MLWLFWLLLLLMLFNKKILILLSNIIEKDINVIKPQFWYIIRMLFLLLLIYHYKDITNLCSGWF